MHTLALLRFTVQLIVPRGGLIKRPATVSALVLTCDVPLLPRSLAVTAQTASVEELGFVSFPA